MVDVAVWMASGSGFESPDARAALKTLWLATKKGHYFAIGYIVQMLLRGRFGILGRVLSLLIMPPLLFWGAWAADAVAVQ